MSDLQRSGPERSRRAALIVEDNATLTSTIEALLDDEGYVTRTARSIASARENVAAQRPDVVLLDLTLLDGFADELLRDLAHAHIPTVVVSTFPLAHVIAARYGASLVRKPFELEGLLAAMDSACRTGTTGA